MLKHTYKEFSAWEYMGHRYQSRKNRRFFRDFHRRSGQHIRNYPSKYLACFAFDGDTARILTDGAPEKEELDCVFDYLKAHNLVSGSALDIGANYGMHSLRFSKDYGQVFSFEPHPAVFQILNFNVAYNNPAKNIAVFNYGLSDKEQVLKLYDHKGHNIGGSTFEAQFIAEKDAAQKFDCPLKVLDDHEAIRGAKIGLLKIDTEGHELSVLKGARNLILEQKPVILIEDWFSRNGTESEMIKYLRELGYTNFLVPALFPVQTPANDKFMSLANKAKFMMKIFLQGRRYGIVECDFSAPKGYDLIIAHM